MQNVFVFAIILYLDEDVNIWTDVFYKETNTHDYLNFTSHHPEHTTRNIPFVLAKRIIVFTSEANLVEQHLNDLRFWLKKCGYPIEVIEIGIHNAKLQGPAPLKKTTKKVPLISTFYSNYDNKIVLEVAKQLLKNSKIDRIKEH